MHAFLPKVLCCAGSEASNVTYGTGDPIEYTRDAITGYEQVTSREWLDRVT